MKEGLRNRWSPVFLKALFILVPILLIANLAVFLTHLKSTERVFFEWDTLVRAQTGNSLPAAFEERLRQERDLSILSIFFLTTLGGTLLWISHVIYVRSRELKDQSDKSLLALEEKMQAILRSSPIILWGLDSVGRLNLLQGQGLQQFQVDPQAMLGRDLFEELRGHNETLDQIRRALMGETVKCELTYHDRWYESTLIPVFTKSGVKGMVGISVDVTDRKSRELEADLANQAKSRFLANMSHEIRTPLGIILGFVDLLSAKDLTQEERENYMGKIRLNAEALAALVNDILDLSKVEAGRIDVEWGDVGLQDLLHDLKESFEMKAAAKGVKFNVKAVGAPLPPAIRTDSTLLRQILVNLLGNALKFTEAGEVCLKVEHHPSEDRRTTQLVFQVIDTGIGISEENRVRLFDPFSQGDPSTARRFGGTGLGLALSRRLAELIHGDLQLLSTSVGRGSVFQLSLRVEIRELGKVRNEGMTTLVKESTPEASARLRGLRVLLVEDAIDNQVLVSTLLKRNGAIVSCACDGREGVEKAFGGDWDLVLMDIQMPGMDGFEATGRLRELGFSRPILALTAHALREEKERALERGFDDYLTKPIDRAELISKIEMYGHALHADKGPVLLNRQGPLENQEFPRL